ncbi:MAG: winged helix-turn-helix domain-containing protein [Deltaproteobacteria bacterium]|nr:winged helix-turn-helix domain-containing protein [Deltaproteobacteria bacterium]
MTARKQPPYAPLRVDTENEWVWCGEHRLKLTPKTFVVLRYLVEHAGRLVTKDQLMSAVWPDTVVSEWALTSCLREIRKALADTPKAPQYIETVHRHGFRFIGKVVSCQSSVVSPPPTPLLCSQLATSNWQREH